MSRRRTKKRRIMRRRRRWKQTAASRTTTVLLWPQVLWSVPYTPLVQWQPRYPQPSQPADHCILSATCQRKEIGSINRWALFFKSFSILVSILIKHKYWSVFLSLRAGLWCFHIFCLCYQAWSLSPSELFQPLLDLPRGGVAWWVTSWLLHLVWTLQPKPSVCLSSTSTTSCFQVRHIQVWT